MKRVAIDVGHAHGTDARAGGLSERDVCEGIAALLRQRLRQAGHVADVIDFPQEDNRGDLVKTARAVNAGAYDVCVSLHCDCTDSPAAHGGHVCFVSAAERKLARAIARRLCKLMPGRAEQVVKRTALYILNATKCVTVLVEFGFLSNDADAAKLSACRMALADAVFDGLMEWFGKQEGAS